MLQEYDFHESYLRDILPRFRNIRDFVRRKPNSGRNFGCSPWSRPVMFGLQRASIPKLANREIISKISNLCDQGTSTSRTDRQTTCRSNIALCECDCVASRGNYH